MARPAASLDCNANGVEDRIELEEGSSPDCNANGLLDGCELDSGLALSRAEELPVGALPHVLEAADLDGDGDLEIVSSDRAADILSVLRNEGGGRFAPAVALAVRDEPRGIDSGDVDADGDLDLVSGNGNEDSFGDLPTNSVFLNRGDGTFEPAVHYLANPSQAGALRSVHLGDLDGDGDLDLTNGFSESPEAGVVTLLFNDGNGVFSALVVLDRGTPGFEGLGWAKYVGVGDADGDGSADIVTFSGQVLFNRGDGSFRAPERFAEVSGAKNLLLEDLDRDGDLDVAILREAGFGGEVLLFRNVEGTFEPVQDPIVLPEQIQEGIAAGDIDGDGDTDLVATYNRSEAVILVNEGEDGIVLAETRFPLEGGVPRWVLMEDLNGDRRLDLALPTSRHAVAVLFHLGGRDADENGVPDECDPRFFRGDANDDGRIDLTDAVFLLQHLFRRGEVPPCLEAADADDDGILTLTDAVYVLAYLFQQGPPPLPPGPPPGKCTEARGSPPFLGCALYTPCG